MGQFFSSKKRKISDTQLRRSLVVFYWLRKECGSLWVPTELKRLLLLFGAGIDSSILSAEEYARLDQRAFDECGVDLTNCKLLFRGTRDGFASKKFHELCDGKGATLTVALTEFGHVIGGFTTVAWQNPIGRKSKFKRDCNAWLFVARVKESKKHLYSGIELPAVLRADDSGNGTHVIHYSGFGPKIGPMLIANDCGTNQVSVCRSPTVCGFADLCDGVALSALAITGGRTPALCGSQFRVVDYEVFACNF